MKKAFTDFRKELDEKLIIVPRIKWSSSDIAAIRADSRVLARKITIKMQDLVGTMLEENTRALMKNRNIRPGDGEKILEAWFELKEWKQPVVERLEKALHARASNSASGPEFAKNRPVGRKIHPPGREPQNPKVPQVFPFSRG